MLVHRLCVAAALLLPGVLGGGPECTNLDLPQAAVCECPSAHPGCILILNETSNNALAGTYTPVVTHLHHSRELAPRPRPIRPEAHVPSVHNDVTLLCLGADGSVKESAGFSQGKYCKRNAANDQAGTFVSNCADNESKFASACACAG